MSQNNDCLLDVTDGHRFNKWGICMRCEKARKETVGHSEKPGCPVPSPIPAHGLFARFKPTMEFIGPVFVLLVALALFAMAFFHGR